MTRFDDRTASVVAQALRVELANDPNIDTAMLEVVERQFNARLSAYREGLDARGPTPTPVRIGLNPLAFANWSDSRTSMTRSHAVPGPGSWGYLVESNDALRASFGAVSLPEELPPSATASHR